MSEEGNSLNVVNPDLGRPRVLYPSFPSSLAPLPAPRVQSKYVKWVECLLIWPLIPFIPLCVQLTHRTGTHGRHSCKAQETTDHCSPVCRRLLQRSCSNSSANQPVSCRPATFCRIPILYKQFTWKPNITFFSLSLASSSLCRVLLHKPEESIVRRGWYVVGNCPSGLSPGGSVSL